jgi:hypothetical protein
MFVDSQGGVDFRLHDYLDQWDHEMRELHLHHMDLWAKGVWRPTVIAVLLDEQERVLVVRDSAWNLFEYPLEKGDGVLARARKGLKEQLGGLDHPALSPLCPTLLAPADTLKIRNVGDQPDEHGFQGKAYCAVAFKLAQAKRSELTVLSDRGNGPPLEALWLSPEAAIEQLLAPSSSLPSVKERFTNVYRPAIRAMIDLLHEFRSRRPVEQRTF